MNHGRTPEKHTVFSVVQAAMRFAVSDCQWWSDYFPCGGIKGESSGQSGLSYINTVIYDIEVASFMVQVVFCDAELRAAYAQVAWRCRIACRVRAGCVETWSQRLGRVWRGDAKKHFACSRS